MTKNTTWKRVAAGVLSLALVAGMMPANVGGFLTGGTAIVAHADDANDIESYEFNIPSGASGSVSYTTPDGLVTLTGRAKDGKLYFWWKEDDKNINEKVNVSISRGILTKIEASGGGLNNAELEFMNVNDDTVVYKELGTDISGYNISNLAIRHPWPHPDASEAGYATKIKVYYQKAQAKTLTASDFEITYPTAENLVYDDQAKAVAATVKNVDTQPTGVHIHYYKQGASGTEVNPTAVGTYYFTITVDADDNYNSTTNALTDESWKFTITKGTNSVTNAAEIADQKVNKKDDIKSATTKFGGDVWYSLTDAMSGEWVSDVKTLAFANNVETTVYYKTAGTENYDSVTGSFKVLYRDHLLSDVTVSGSGSNAYASYRLASYGIDVRGKSGNSDVQVTYGNKGFETYMQTGSSTVNNYSKDWGVVRKDATNKVEFRLVPKTTKADGTTATGIILEYTIANYGFEDKTVRVGSYGDTMLNGNDACNVSLSDGRVVMTSGSSQFNASALEGSITDFKGWVGRWSGSNHTSYVFYEGNGYNTGNDSACSWHWDITVPAGETITRQVLLSATCEPVVNFHLNYPGCTDPESQAVNKGAKITIDDPHRAGYDFTGWTYTKGATVTKDEDGNIITNPASEQSFVSNQTVVNDHMNVYAHWKMHEYEFSLSQDKATVTADCVNTMHPESTDPATLTINADSVNYDGQPHGATLTQTNDFIAEVEGANGDEIKIMYVGVGGTEYAATEDLPTAAGNYKAYVVVTQKVSETDVRTVTAEKNFSILEKFDLSDDHTNDPLVRKNDNVRNVITSVAADLNGNGEFDADETATFDGDFPSKEVYYTQGAKVRVTSKAKLQFTTDTDKVVDFGEEYSSRSGYTYTFTVPYGVNIVTVKRIYKYSFRNDGTKQYGKDDNLHNAQEYLVAELIANDYEYLAPRETDVYLDVDPAFELAYDIAYSYTRDSAPVDDPQDIGAYHVIAQFSTNEQVYKIEDDFNITPRNYATHSGTAATETNEIKAVLGFESNKTVYNGGVQTPEVTVTDKLGDADTKTLVRGTDYELGYLDNNGAFVKVDPADDDAKLGGTNVGEYKVYVNFINNYMNKVDGVEGPVELVWNIVAKAIVADDVTNPLAIQPLTYNAADQFLVSPGSVATEGEGASARPIGTVKYRLGADGEFSVNVPKAMNAGIYTVYWYVEGDSNHTNYGSEEQPFAVENIVIAPKAVQAANLTISTSNEAFTYDGTEKKYSTVIVKDNGIRIDSSEYEVSYENNVNAGENTAKVIISDAKTGETVGEETGNYTIVNPAEKNFSIAKATPTIEVQPKETITYDNAEVDVTDFTVNENNTDNHDVQLTFYADNDGEKGAELDDAPVNVGTYWAVVTIPATDNFNEVKSSAVKFTVVPRDISNVTITVNAADEPVADGENAKIPDAITVADGQINKTLEADTDFTVEYGNNIIAGSAATITLTGTGNYTGTATGKYNVLSVLDISEVKDLIQSIEYMNGVTNPEFEDTYKYRTNTAIKIKSTGVLKFGDLAPACVVVEEDLNYYYYELTIPDNTNSTKVTHIYNYQTDQHTDTNGLVTVSGVDNNIKNNTNWVPIATMSMDDVYYLDDADSKITVTDKEAPGITLGEPEYTYTKNSQTASIVNHKPVNAGNYRVQIKVNVTDGDGVEYVKVNMDFAVKPRPYDNNEIKVDIEQDEFTYSTYDITPVITVTDSKRADAETTLVAGKDYELVGDITKTNHGDYRINVNFIGNYTGTTVVNWKINPKNIGDDDIQISYPKVSALTVGEWTYCEPITIKYHDQVLIQADGIIENPDYMVTRDSTNRVRDNLSVLINGKGNYTGNTYLDWRVVAIEDAGQVDFSFIETYVSDKKEEKENRIKFNATATVADGFNVKETGVIYFNAANGAPQADLTIDNVGGDIKKAFKTEDNYLVGLLDNGNGVYARFYSIISNGCNDYVVYATDDAEYYNFAEIAGEAAKNATTQNVEFLETYVSNGKNRIKFNATTAVEEGYEVKETGVIYFNAEEGTPQADLTIGNLGGNIKKAGKAGDTYLVGLLDNGNGVYARFYSIVTDGHNEFVVYATDDAEYYNFAELSAQLN